jgi:hypothetical protein
MEAILTPPMPVKGWRLVRCSKTFDLAGNAAPGFPVVLNSKGLIVIPIVDYLSERVISKRVSMGTIIDEAYILRDWFRFCERCQQSWKRPSDELMMRWRVAEEARLFGRSEFDREGRVRISRKLSMVYRFYHLMQTTLGAFEHRVISEPYRDDRGKMPLTVDVVHVRASNGKTRQRILNRISYTTVPDLRAGRPTPTPDEAELVIHEALDSPEDFAGASHYLMGRLMYDVGLRAIGVSSISLQAIANGLLKREIGNETDIAFDLQDVGENQYICDDIKCKLNGLVSAGKIRTVPVQVTEKRQVTRSVEVPVGLLIEILDYIWDDRRRFVLDYETKNVWRKAGSTLFISSKTGQGFLPKSISNCLAMAFRRAGVVGSPHRLRAAAARNRMREQYMRARAADGPGFDRNIVLYFVGQYLGHRNTKSLEYYLNDLQTEQFLDGGEPVLVRDPNLVPKVLALLAAINERSSSALDSLSECLELLGRKPCEQVDDVKGLTALAAEHSDGRNYLEISL